MAYICFLDKSCYLTVKRWPFFTPVSTQVSHFAICVCHGLHLGWWYRYYQIFTHALKERKKERKNGFKYR
jgi:hypothetical protein